MLPERDPDVWVPGVCCAENERCVTGRVWPGATRGTDLMGKDIVMVVRKVVSRRTALWHQKIGEGSVEDLLGTLVCAGLPSK